MNVLFLTLANVDIAQHGIYSDLMRYFVQQGHNVYIVSPVERRLHKPTCLNIINGVHYLHVKTLNIQKTNLIEKGIGTILLEGQFKRAIKHYLKGIHFDLLLYSTPPITFSNVIKYIKHTNKYVVSYLLLKDINPQNAVDLGMIKAGGLIHRYFRHKEINLYLLSDFIGCMSPANVEYVLRNNCFLRSRNVEIAPNSIEITNPTPLDRENILNHYSLPINKTLFVYGGNLGKPQGIPFLIECLESIKNREDCHFIIVGDGTEYAKLEQWFKTSLPNNVTLLRRIPKEDYDLLIRACHVGLIFLDYRFTIPNFPSRLLPYLQYKMPIIAATDPNTDIGTIAENNKFGYACLSNNAAAFQQCINKMLASDMKQMGENGYHYLTGHYTVKHTYDTIIKHLTCTKTA